ncbi:MAG: fumarylacetoacetate hydrolase family protein [Rhodospirillaceae bacterium]
MEKLAARLWQARQTGEAISPDEGAVLTDDSQAYDVQAKIVELSGQAVIGYKVGSTSPEAQKKLGTTEPGSSPVLATYYHESPAQIRISLDQSPGVEGEFLVRLGKDLPPSGNTYGIDEVMAAVDAVAGCVEVVGCRFAGGLAGKGRLLIAADCYANMNLVHGPFTYDWRDLNMPDHPVRLAINGLTRQEGTGAKALGNPLNVLVWLANKQSASGLGLKAGDVIATGTCTGIEPVQPGEDLTCDFGSLGTVKIAFS